jgi:DNA-binding GntR family transcriptional regulator
MSEAEELELAMAPKKGRDLRDDKRFAGVVGQFAGRYQTIGQMVYTVLHEAIMSGAFAPGEWLRQESIAEAIGVSRIPVRTALLQLEAEGLVTFNPHRGARVRALSASQIEEIYRLRLLLESHALRLSMARMRPERLTLMRQLAEHLDDESEGAEFLDARVRFYREVYDAVSNPLLVDMIEELRGHVGRYLLGFRAVGHSHTHRELVNHIEAGDLMAAEAWLRAHLEEVGARIADLARQAEDDDDESAIGRNAPGMQSGADGSAQGGEIAAARPAEGDDAAAEPGGPQRRRQLAKAADVSRIVPIR